MGIDSFSKIYYERPNVVQEIFHNHHWIWPEEEMIFKRYETHICGKRVLDIGCGGGRIIPALKALAQDYIGIDYSVRMIKACKEKFESLKFIHCDASDMTIFNDQSFDFVLFTFNGIDCMSHEKRIKTLKEINRILKYDGIFVFSSHNLDDRRHVTAYNIFDINVFNNIQNILSYLKVRKHQIRTETYAILSDPLAGYGHLTYFIRKPDQVIQLKQSDFSDVEILNCKCRFTEIASLERDSKWFWYICKKQK
ncbi:class I SAM-dependent methyltransferase [Desulfococcaceae bacterium HSG9]|nr:class I SAM-dependent methyltransferase [Desulfococcaceae bacterium HSG9]